MQVGISGATDLVHHLPAVIDQTLNGPEALSCPFRTFRQSPRPFARAVCQQRLSGGRCAATTLPAAAPAGTAAGCGLYDLNYLYFDPPISELTFCSDTPKTRSCR